MPNVKTIPPRAFQMGADYARKSWHIVVPNDWSLEEILRPEAWVHVAGIIGLHAVVDVVTEDGNLDMQLRVTRIKDGLVYMRPRFGYENKEARAALIASVKSEENRTPEELVQEARKTAPEGYKCGWNPGKKWFYVQHKLTGKILFENLPTMAIAIAKANEHSTLAKSVAA